MLLTRGWSHAIFESSTFNLTFREIVRIFVAVFTNNLGLPIISPDIMGQLHSHRGIPAQGGGGGVL